MKKILLIALASWMAVISVYSANQSDDAKVDAKGSFVRLRESTTVYPGGGGTYHAFPEKYEGYRIARRELDSAKPAVFTVKNAGLVRVTAVGGVVSELKLDGWVEIGRISIRTADGEISKDVIYILEKRLEAGDYSIPCHGNYGVRLLKK